MPTESTINLAIVMDVEVTGEEVANGQQSRAIVQGVTAVNGADIQSDPSFIEAADQIQIQPGRGTSGPNQDGKSVYGGDVKSVYNAKSVYGDDAKSTLGGPAKSVYGGQTVADAQSNFGGKSVAAPSVYGGQTVAPSAYGGQTVADAKSNFGGKSVAAPSVYGGQTVAPSAYGGQTVAPSVANAQSTYGGAKSVYGGAAPSAYGGQTVAPSVADAQSTYGGAKSVYGGAAQSVYGGQTAADAKSNFGGKSVYGGAAPSAYGGQTVAPSVVDAQSTYGGAKSVYGGQTVADAKSNFGGAKSVYGGQTVADAKSNFGGAKSVYGGQTVADAQSTFGVAKSVFQGEPGNDAQSAFGGAAKSIYPGQTVADAQSNFGGAAKSVYGGAAKSVYGAEAEGEDEDLRSISQMDLAAPIPFEPIAMEVNPEVASRIGGASVAPSGALQAPGPVQMNLGQVQQQFQGMSGQQFPNPMLPYQQQVVNPQQLQFQLCIQRPMGFQGQGCVSHQHHCSRPCASMCPPPCPRRKCCRPKMHACRAQPQCIPATLSCGYPQQSQQYQEPYYPPGNWNPQMGQGQGQPLFQNQLNPQGIPQQFQQNPGMPPGQNFPLQNPSSFPIQQNMGPGMQPQPSVVNAGMQPQPSIVNGGIQRQGNQGQGMPRVLWAGFGAPPGQGQMGMMQSQSYGSQGSYVACGGSFQNDNGCQSDEEECQPLCAKPKTTCCCCRRKSKPMKCCIPFCIESCPKKRNRCKCCKPVCCPSNSVRFFTPTKNPCKMMEVFPVCPKPSSCAKKSICCRPRTQSNCPMFVSGIGCDRTFPSLSPLDRRRELCVPGMKMFDLTGSCANHARCRNSPPSRGCCEQRGPSRSSFRCPTVCEIYSVCTEETRKEKWSTAIAGKRGNTAENCGTDNKALADVPYNSKPEGPSDPSTDKKAIMDGYTQPNPQDQGGREDSQRQLMCPNSLVVVCPMKRRCCKRPVIKLAQQSLPPHCSSCQRNPCTQMMMLCPDTCVSKQRCKTACPPVFVECLRSCPPKTILDCSPGPMRIFSQGHRGGLCRMKDCCRRCSAVCSVREALCGRIRPPTICELRSACIDECQEQQRQRESGQWYDSYGQGQRTRGGERQQYGRGGRPNMNSNGERAIVDAKRISGGGANEESGANSLAIGPPQDEMRNDTGNEMEEKQLEVFPAVQDQMEEARRLSVVRSKDPDFPELIDTDNDDMNPQEPLNGYYENVTRYTRIIENRFSVERLNEDTNPHKQLAQGQNETFFEKQSDDTKSRSSRLSQGQNDDARSRVSGLPHRQNDDAKSRVSRLPQRQNDDTKSKVSRGSRGQNRRQSQPKFQTIL